MAMSGIKAIETVYNGYRFRSRLEARWAVFFDALKVKYQYEPEGFDLGKYGRYLPDFWLPDHDCWIEIKPEWNADAGWKAAALADGTGKDVFMLDRPEFSVPSMSNGDISGAWARRFRNLGDQHDGDCGFNWAECIACKMDGMHVTGEREEDGSPIVKWPLGFIGIQWSDHWKAHTIDHHGAPDDRDAVHRFGCDDTVSMINAYLAARQARFEHGERGR